MKRIFTLIIIFALALSSFAQIPNSGFENWAGTPEEPVDWATPNPLTASISAGYTVVKSTDANSGTYAAKLETKQYIVFFSDTILVPGVLSTGELSFNFSTGQPIFEGGTPFTGRPEKITAYYKYMPAANDSFGVFGFMTKWNTSTSTRDTVGTVMYSDGQTVNTYTKLEIPVNYSSTAHPDTFMLVFSSSKDTSSITKGSVLMIDNVGVEWFLNANNPQQDIKVKVFPNPASDIVTFVVPTKNAYTVTFYDIVGAKMDDYNFDSPENSIDVSGLRNGMYFYEIKNLQGKLIKNGRLSISH